MDSKDNVYPEDENVSDPGLSLRRHGDLLSEQQQRVAQMAVRSESVQRHHVVVYLSGAHAYGFSSPDSDLDLKAVHVAPTRTLVGLYTPKLSADRFETVDGVEVDYTSNELGMVLSGILDGNGNYIEWVLGKTWLAGSSELDQLRPLTRAVLSRKVFRHYAGFAKNQYGLAFEVPAVPTKKVLYVLRTALTGAHLLRSGEVVTDLNQLLDEYDVADARVLIEQKRAGERVTLGPEPVSRWRKALERVFKQLDAAHDASCLPLESENIESLAEWFLAVRKAHW
jgi:predicted nucleotidyltransferase